MALVDALVPGVERPSGRAAMKRSIGLSDVLTLLPLILKFVGDPVNYGKLSDPITSNLPRSAIFNGRNRFRPLKSDQIKL